MTSLLTKFEQHLNITHENITAIDALADSLDFSRQKIKKIMNQGAVWLTDGKNTRRLRRASKKLQQGQMLHLYYNEKILQNIDYKAILIADEDDYSVWFKPSGMPSQGSKYGDHSAIYRWAETHIQPQRNAFLVHRLDKATNGLILIAHSKNAAQKLSELFATRAINKYYKALIHGQISTPQSIDYPLENKKAITQILSAQNYVCNTIEYSLLDIQLLTGRKHQIRQHLKQLGHSIIGDRLYGNATKDSIDLCLCSYKLSFISPFDQTHKHYELDSSYYPQPSSDNYNKEYNNENQ